MKNRWVRFGVGVGALAVVAGLSFGAVAHVQAQDAWYNLGGPRVAPIVWAGGPRGGGEFGQGEFGQRGDSLATIAKALGISESDLTTAIKGGKTVADVATEKKVALSTVVDAIVAERTTVLKQAVTDGRITQAQADARIAKLKADLPSMLSTKMPKRSAGGRQGEGMGMFRAPVTIAKALGISESDLATALKGGKTVADIAKEKGVALSTVVDAILAEQTTALKQAVTAGRITQAQADARIAKLKTDLPTVLSTKMPERPAGGHHFGGHGPNQSGPQNPPSPLAPSGTDQSSGTNSISEPFQSA